MFQAPRGSHSFKTLVAATFLLLSVSSARAGVFIVTTTADGNNGSCTVSTCTLRDAVIAANGSPGSSITLPSNVSHYTLTLTGVNEDNAATGDLDVKADLTINGGGSATTIIDGNGTDRVFQVIGAFTLTLNDVTVRNGNTSTSTSRFGGGIFASTGTVVLNNSVVTANNGSTFTGGGIQAATLTMTNSTVSNNQNTNQGGGISGATVTLTNSTVSGNQTTDQGAGIFASTVTITNSTISGNQSTGDQGGGLFLFGNSNITNSSITGNTSGDSGGGFYLNGPAILNITNSTISNNTGPNAGAMFLLSPATVTITASTISGNTAVSSGGGGAILNSGTTLTITNSTIVGNTVTISSSGGGGLRNQSGTSTISNSTIDSNSAPLGSEGESFGGGIVNNSGTVTLKNTIIANNTSGNCVGTIGDSGTNLQFPGTTCGAGITTGDPLLQALANNGGPTQTQSLGSGSPAIDQGTTGCPPVPATDQRGVTRPQGAGCEIGAFECRTSLGECVAGQATATPTNTPTLTLTSTPTNTPVGVATSTPTRTPTQGGAPAAVVPTLSFPMLILFGLALAGATLLFLKRSA